MGRVRVGQQRRARFGVLAAVVVACLVACAAPPRDAAVPVVIVAAAALTPHSVTPAPVAPQPSALSDLPALTTLAAAGEALTTSEASVRLLVTKPPANDAPDAAFERGEASWYGMQFRHRRTANGERLDPKAMTAAHKTLPFGTLVCAKNLGNGRAVQVRINDRGPYTAGRIIDLSRAAADSIGMSGRGIKQVSLSQLGPGERCGVVNPADELAPSAAAPARRLARHKLPVRAARGSHVRRARRH